MDLSNLEWMAMIGIALLSLSNLVLLIVLLTRQEKGRGEGFSRHTQALLEQKLTAMKVELTGEIRNSRMELSAGLQDRMNSFFTQMSAGQQQSSAVLNDRLADFNQRVNITLKQLGEGQEKQARQQDLRMEQLQRTTNLQLEQMRQTVDEKLQKTLDDRIGQSFRLVHERLQEVYQGLGEMKTLATDVGDLKKVLSNVKTRGILGEYQLGAIIEELLTSEQYEENVITKPGTANRVEFAIRLPGDGNQPVYLPVDAKFPADLYYRLVEAREGGNGEEIRQAEQQLELRIKGCAKEIREKYVSPPNTTDFAILFLPFEGLYAEVVRSGLVDLLQREYQVNIAGPTTFSALLNSLRMGFRTLAIQQRSGEVWQLLGAVKTEFATFEEVLTLAQKRMEQTQKELDKLVGVRTRQINHKLREVALLPKEESKVLLEEDSSAEEGWTEAWDLSLQ